MCAPRFAACALLVALPALAPASVPFTVRGSAEQVDVTGARPGATLTPCRSPRARRAARAGRLPRRAAVPRRHARGRLPGRAASGAASVGAAHGARPTAPRRRARSIYNQRIPTERLRLPDHPRRDEARDRRAPAAAGSGPVPDAGRVRRATATPTRPAPESGDRADRQPARLRRRRREHARHRLLGRRVRLLRAAAEPRRLRRDRDRRAPALGAASQGRDDRHLLRRDQPAVRRRDRPAGPRGDHAAVGDRRHARRRCTRAGSSTPASRCPGPKDRVHDAKPASATGGQPWALQADPRGRQDVQGQPGAARRGRQPAREGQRRTTTTSRRSPIRSPRSRSCTRSRSRSTSPASSPTSRPAGTAPTSPSTSPARARKWFTFTNGVHTDSLDPATFNRWYDFLELFVARQRAEPAGRRSRPRRRRLYNAVHGRRRRDAARRPDPVRAELRGGAGGVRAAAAGADPVRQRRRQRDARATRSPGSSSRSRASRCPGTRRALVVPRAPADA